MDYEGLFAKLAGLVETKLDGFGERLAGIERSLGVLTNQLLQPHPLFENAVRERVKEQEAKMEDERQRVTLLEEKLDAQCERVKQLEAERLERECNKKLERVAEEKRREQLEAREDEERRMQPQVEQEAAEEERRRRRVAMEEERRREEVTAEQERIVQFQNMKQRELLIHRSSKMVLDARFPATTAASQPSRRQIGGGGSSVAAAGHSALIGVLFLVFQ
jgi:septal ring factor EnvC (AmiA/AmiB activator)